ncbi:MULTISPECIES: thioredoxin family protein [Pseudomonas]|uniref:Thioredoxin n=1 Tax=Pseudomonas oryzihabitans TaxID=47885 RepID=A0A0U4VR77_9PSED|nr:MULTISPECIES: thioredoxin family protein [Pseudomonas]ALZ85559.1 thioredoxin [Pseudomonas oryzihabitans]WCE10457.1 thioredoxin family protein [Pseudomonas sp. JBR1]HAC69728.1 thioredoxin [Pseudomonas sp.]
MELDDGTADAVLLEAPGRSLLIFTSVGCATCRLARQVLPAAVLPVDRLYWVDAERSGGLVQRYGVFHLPALFLVRDGEFLGPVQAPLREPALVAAIQAADGRESEELP